MPEKEKTGNEKEEEGVKKKKQWPKQLLTDCDYLSLHTHKRARTHTHTHIQQLTDTRLHIVKIRLCLLQPLKRLRQKASAWRLASSSARQTDNGTEMVPGACEPQKMYKKQDVEK